MKNELYVINKNGKFVELNKAQDLMVRKTKTEFEDTISNHLNKFEAEFGELDKIIMISKGNDIRLLLIDEVKVNYIG
jgi:hypothetical protein